MATARRRSRSSKSWRRRFDGTLGILMHVAVLTFSRAAVDSRIVRQVSALREAGHRVSVVAPGREDDRLGDAFVRLPDRVGGWVNRIRTALQHAPANVLPSSAHRLYWFDRRNRQTLARLRDLSPDCIHANDWITLPIAVRCKRERGCAVVYDSHELAVEENDERLIWRIVSKNFVSAIERDGIGAADGVITVSDGIAGVYRELYGLPMLPTVVRNVPAYQKQAFRPAGRPLSVLFHGLLRPGRGIETLIESVALWRPDRRLTIRGFGSAAYEAVLRQRVVQLGIADRVDFAPAVPPGDVVASANEADIGIVCPPIVTRQYDFSLPNKFFEYIMAGLAICVTPGADMAAIVRGYELGRIFEDASPQAFARAINSLEPEAVDACKQNALAAAYELSWDREKERLLSVYASLAVIPAV